MYITSRPVYSAEELPFPKEVRQGSDKEVSLRLSLLKHCPTYVSM